MKKLITLFLIVLLALPTYLAIGQSENIILHSGGTTTSTVGPVPGGYGFHLSASLFTRSEMQAAGVDVNAERIVISKLAFEISQRHNTSTRKMKILLKEVSETTLNTGIPYNTLKSGAIEVFNNQTGVDIPSTGWHDFVFTRNFNYSGVGSLLILVEGEGCTRGNGCIIRMFYNGTSTNSINIVNDDSQAPFDLSLNDMPTIEPVHGRYYRFRTRITVTALNTTIPEYTIIASAGIGGSISPNGTVSVLENQTQRFDFNPDVNYEIENVWIDSVANPLAVSNKYYIFEAVTSDHTIHVEFKEGEIGINDCTIQNVRIYSYLNSVYIENRHQIPLNSIEIMDMTGRVIYSSSSVKSPISLDIAKGAYIVRLMSNDAVLNRKIVIR